MKKPAIKLLLSAITVAALFAFYSCGNAETKAGPKGDDINMADSAGKNANRPSEDRIPGDSGAATTGNLPGHDDILANIDQYLVSTANIPTPPASGGIYNASVTIKNTLTDVTIQKAIIEVSILTAEGAEFRTDYHVLQNIEPGEVETIKIPNAARGNSIVCHVVKIKSQELTNGETVLVGHRITAK